MDKKTFLSFRDKVFDKQFIFFKKYFNISIEKITKGTSIPEFPQDNKWPKMDINDIFEPSIDKYPKLEYLDDIAIVYPGAFLRDREYGKEIDKHQCIIRINAAPTLGYEKFVGSKCHIRTIGIKGISFLVKTFPKKIVEDFFLNLESIFYYPHLDDANYLPENYELIEEKNIPLYRDYFKINMMSFLISGRPNIYNKELRFKVIRASAGLQNILVGLSLGKKVTIYGLPLFKEQFRKNTYYYHEYVPSTYDGYLDTSMHSFLLEKELVKRLIENHNNIVFKL